MRIGFRCRSCRQKLTIAATAAGTRQKCPRCQTELVVPQPAAAGAVEPAGPAQHRGEPVGERTASREWEPAWRAYRVRPTPTEEFEQRVRHTAAEFPSYGLEILKAFGPPVARTKLTWGYKLGVLVVAMVMVALPLIYFTMVGSICYAMFWYFTEGQFWLFAGVSAGLLPYLLGFAVAMIGAVVVLFLLKPVFARPVNRVRTRSITPQSDPLMFAFVAKVCDVVGAPFPSRIDVSYDVNASASFRHGLGSILKGNDLVLTIGAPLVSSLTMRQFAGVLAHEFGHFSQGTGMRLTYLIRSISEWFARVVYQRDEWDKFIERLCGFDYFPLPLVFWPARIGVWLSRQVLRLLMNVGLLVGGFLLRQMEFDADRYEARVAGSDEFAQTSWRIQLTGYAWLHAQSQISQLAERDILIDDVALLIRHHVSGLSDAIKQQIQRDLTSGRCGLFDSHPSEAARFRSVQREASPGIFTMEGEAHRLFSDFQTLSKNVTWDLYCQFLRRRVRRESLQDTQTVLLRYRIGGGTVRPWNEPDYY